jgi:hypothetical protein
VLVVAAVSALGTGGVLVERSGLPSAWPWEKDEDDGGWLVFVLAAAAALLLLLLLCRLCLRTGPPERSPLDRANLVSRATFWWVTPTLSAALRKGVLDLDDLPALPAADQPRRLAQRFVHACGTRRKLRPAALLAKVIFSAQRAVFAQSFFAGWIFMGCMFLDPILLGQLLRNPPSPEDPASVWPSLGLVLLLTASMLGRVTCMEQCYFHSCRASNNARTLLVMAVFRASVHPRHDHAYLAHSPRPCLPSTLTARGTEHGSTEHPPWRGRPQTRCPQTRCSHASAARTQVMRAGPTSAAHTGRLTNLVATDADRIGKAETITWLVSQAAVARRTAMLGTANWYHGAYRHGQ